MSAIRRLWWLLILGGLVGACATNKPYSQDQMPRIALGPQEPCSIGAVSPAFLSDTYQRLGFGNADQILADAAGRHPETLCAVFLISRMKGVGEQQRSNAVNFLNDCGVSYRVPVGAVPSAELDAVEHTPVEVSEWPGGVPFSSTDGGTP